MTNITIELLSMVVVGFTIMVLAVYTAIKYNNRLNTPASQHNKENKND